MKQIFRVFMLSFFILTLISCNQERRSKNLMGAAKLLESNFKDKDIATEKINQVVADYLASLDYDSTSFDRRFELFSQNYLSKMKRLINHAKVSNQRTVEGLMISEQIQVFSLRKSFSLEQLETLSVKEVMAIQNENSFAFGMSEAEFKNLLFYSSNQASGAIKSAFSISPVLFDRELNEWKIDLFGDPLHQKMKEEKLASLQNKSYSAYKESMREIMDVDEKSWIPLKEIED